MARPAGESRSRLARALPSVEERKASGRALRARLPRADQGTWTLDRRRDGLLAPLRAAVAGRRADLLPIRWGRMSASPFAFFRGTAALMAADLGPRPDSGLVVQLCGDAHLLNLGAYAAPDGHLVFDLNDFDETCRGPFDWDLKRLVASLVVGGRSAGIADAACRAAVHRTVRAYREALARFSEMGIVDLARLELTPRSGSRPLGPIFRSAERHTPRQLLDKATRPDRGGLARFRSEPPLLVPLRAGAVAAVLAALRSYRETLAAGWQQALQGFTVHDVAFRVAGTGSVGVTCLVALLYGNGGQDPLFLQLKAEDPSCWQPFLRASRRNVGGRLHQGRRVAEGQLRAQAVADPFLGWTRMGRMDFVVRQWSDHKAAVDPSMLDRDGLARYGALCGQVLARAHARSGDGARLAGYCGAGDRLDRALGAFASAYADQVDADFGSFRRAIRAGQLPAVRGV